MQKTNILIYGVILLISLFFIFAWLIPSYWNWAIFDFITLFPINIILLILAVILIIPAIGKPVFEYISKFTKLLIEKLERMPAILKAVLWITIPGIIFLILRSRCFILGDGNLILGHIVEGNLISKTAFGYSLLIQFIADVTNISSHDNAAVLVAVISVMCGVIYLYFTHKIISLLITNKPLANILFITTALSGISVLFMGYIETYPILTAWSALFTYYALRILLRKGNFAFLIIIFVSGVFWHIWFIAFLPALIYVLFSNSKLLSKYILLIFTAVFLSAIYWGGSLITRSGIPLTIPFIPNTNTNYYLFSPAHLIDFFNAIIITGPVFVLAGILVLLIVRGGEKVPEITFMKYASFPVLVIAFSIDPVLGAVRDWDMLSIFAFPCIISGVLLLSDRYNFRQYRQYIIIPILLITIVHTSGFAKHNMSLEMGLNRVINVLADDPHYKNEYYNGKRTMSFAYYLKTHYARIGAAEDFLSERTYDKRRNKDLGLAITAYNNNFYGNAVIYYERYLKDEPLPSIHRLYYAKSLLATSNADKAIEQFNLVLKDTVYALPYKHIFEGFLKKDVTDSALYYAEKYISQSEDSIKAIKDCAEISLENNHPDLVESYNNRLK